MMNHEKQKQIEREQGLAIGGVGGDNTGGDGNSKYLDKDALAKERLPNVGDRVMDEKSQTRGASDGQGGSGGAGENGKYLERDALGKESFPTFSREAIEAERQKLNQQEQEHEQSR